MGICTSCKHRNVNLGECRRFPPTVVPRPGVGGGHIVVWPRVDWDYWCGEFKDKEEIMDVTENR